MFVVVRIHQLQVNRMLTSLDLSFNKIFSNDATAIGDALKVSAMLRDDFTMNADELLTPMPQPCRQ